jgi:hypothetical protein
MAFTATKKKSKKAAEVHNVERFGVFNDVPGAVELALIMWKSSDASDNQAKVELWKRRELVESRSANRQANSRGYGEGTSFCTSGEFEKNAISGWRTMRMKWALMGSQWRALEAMRAVALAAARLHTKRRQHSD